jgi:uncharacterized membrane protein YdjX (TVP38/TMEM64 family)
MGGADPVTNGSPRKVRIWVALAWLALVGAFQLWSWRSGIGPTEGARRLVDVAGMGVVGVLIYVGVSLLRPVLLIPATLITVAAGVLYGPVAGTVIALGASTASAVVAYLVGRWLITVDVAEEATGKLGARLVRLRTRSFETVLTLRLLLAPFDVVNYAAGFLRVRLVPFTLATIVGGIPATTAFVLAGASVERFDGAIPSLDLRTVAASVGLLIVSLALTAVVRRKQAADPA